MDVEKIRATIVNARSVEFAVIIDLLEILEASMIAENYLSRIRTFSIYSVKIKFQSYKISEYVMCVECGLNIAIIMLFIA